MPKVRGRLPRPRRRGLREAGMEEPVGSCGDPGPATRVRGAARRGEQPGAGEPGWSLPGAERPCHLRAAAGTRKGGAQWQNPSSGRSINFLPSRLFFKPRLGTGRLHRLRRSSVIRGARWGNGRSHYASRGLAPAAQRGRGSRCCSRAATWGAGLPDSGCQTSGTPYISAGRFSKRLSASVISCPVRLVTKPKTEAGR